MHFSCDIFIERKESQSLLMFALTLGEGPGFRVRARGLVLG